MAPEKKELLAKSDIRTMIKDLRKFKKAGFAKKKEPQSEAKTMSYQKIGQEIAVQKSGEPTVSPLKEVEPTLGPPAGQQMDQPVEKYPVEREVTRPAIPYQREAEKVKLETNNGRQKTDFSLADDKINQPVQNQLEPKSPSWSPEKDYLKKVPLSQREKIEAADRIKGKERIKFMEEVEKWAAGQKDNNK